MNIKLIFLGVVAFGLVGTWVASCEEAERQEQSRARAVAALELARVSTTDPLMNLAGCMVNHATEVSKLLLGSAVHKIADDVHMSKEEIEQFNEIRDVLYHKCSPIYRQKILDVHGSFTVANVNHAFVEILKQDSVVAGHMKIYADAKASRSEIYAK